MNNKTASKTANSDSKQSTQTETIDKALALTDKLKQASDALQADSQASKTVSKTVSKTASKTAVKQDHAVKLTINQSAVYQQSAVIR